MIYGGSAGGGKSFGLLLEPTRYINVPDFQAIIFRRTLPQIKKPGSLWDTSFKIYKPLGATPTRQPMQWTFPNRVTISFDQLQYDDTVYEYDGSQIPFIGFDQLESFSKFQFTYMLSRNRSTCGVRPYVRASCNPEKDSWLLELIGWWIDEAGDPIKERSGIVRYFVTIKEEFVIADSAEELAELYPDLIPKSFTFIHADLYDNKILMEADPGYVGNLMALPEHERKRLLDGNWKTAPEGKLFKAEWWKRCGLDQVPDIVRCCTAVDPSGGDEEHNDEQGIVTAGLGRDGKVYVFEDASCSLTPLGWGGVAIGSYKAHNAGAIVAETNYGGDMVESNIKNAGFKGKYEAVSATRGKAVRAEPVAALYEDGMIIHVGPQAHFRIMENECIGFDPLSRKKSPNRMDALVWAVTWLLVGDGTAVLDFYKNAAMGLDEEAQKRIAKRLEALRAILKPKG